MGGSYKGGNEDTCPFLCRSLCYPYDGNCEYYCFCECKGFAIDCTCAVQNGDIPRGCGIWDDEVVSELYNQREMHYMLRGLSTLI